MCAIYFRSSPFTSKVPKNDVKLESFESEENCVCMRGKLFYLPYHPGPLNDVRRATKARMSLALSGTSLVEGEASTYKKYTFIGTECANLCFIVATRN